MKTLIVAVAPTGRRVAYSLCGERGDHEVRTFPDSPLGRAFRSYRVSLGLSLGDAARALEVSVVAVGEVERGAAVFTNWNEAVAILENAATRNGAPPND